jgi:hypothetical protein
MSAYGQKPRLRGHPGNSGVLVCYPLLSDSRSLAARSGQMAANGGQEAGLRGTNQSKTLDPGDNGLAVCVPERCTKDCSGT